MNRSELEMDLTRSVLRVPEQNRDVVLPALSDLHDPMAHQLFSAGGLQLPVTAIENARILVRRADSNARIIESRGADVGKPSVIMMAQIAHDVGIGRGDFATLGRVILL